MKKKALSLLLAFAMVVSMTACGGDGKKKALDWSAVNAMDHDASSDALYEYNLGDFNEYYQEAKKEVTDLDKRMALMAISEAKLLESGVLQPAQARGGNYAISRVVPRSISTVLWGLDEDKWHTALVANELIKTEDRNELISIWSKAESAKAWNDSAKAFLQGKGYTLNDTYNFATGYELVTWDVIATSQTSDSYFIACTYTGLMEYDALNQQQPALAESYEVSDDGLTYTFHIRPNVNWVDQQGRVIGKVTADDWVASMQHVADNHGELGYLMSADGGCGIKNYDAWINGELADFSEVGVKAVDESTLVYTLEAPFPAFLTMLGYGCFAPLNRSFYKSQGGTFKAEGDVYTPGNYATSPSTIAYCGAYLVTNYTQKNVTSYKLNPEYWNKDAVNVPNVNIYYNDGTDTLRSYNETKSNTIAGAGLNASAVEQAKKETPPGETKTYFDLYSYTSALDATTYCGWINVNRASWANSNDNTMGISTQTDEVKERTRQAVNNQNFRLALTMAFDRGAYNAVSVGEELKLVSLRNSYTPGTFLATSKEVTVKINGKDTKFPAGTYYGQILQAQLDADKIPIKVWDPTADGGVGSGDGFDGWFNETNAVSYLEKAIAELKEVGVEISAENPIYLDIPHPAYDDTSSNQKHAYKQSIEKVLGGRVIVNLVDYPDRTAYNAAYYRITNGAQANYDVSPAASGWGPDYGDAQSYLDTMQPYAYMDKNIGLY